MPVIYWKRFTMNLASHIKPGISTKELDRIGEEYDPLYGLHSELFKL